MRIPIASFPGWKTWGMTLALGLLSACPPAGQSRSPDVAAALPAPAVPVLAEPAWRIASNPDMGAWSDPGAQPVDFSIWQAADGTWQLVACVRGTRYPGRGRVLFRWESDRLTDEDWTPMGIFMTSDVHEAHREGQLQAPHVVRDGGRYVMIYSSNGAAFLLSSRDGKSFTRERAHDGDVRLFEMNRDVMLFDNRPRDGLWYAYYTWITPHRHPDRKDHSVGVRTAGSLRGPWSAAIDVGVRTPILPDDPHSFIDAESPFVLFRNGYYYRWEQMNVFASDDPKRWRDRELTTMTPGDPRGFLAPEIVEQDGQFYLAGYRYDEDWRGIYMAPFSWQAP
jgi:hypothetical protein